MTETHTIDPSEDEVIVLGTISEETKGRDNGTPEFPGTKLSPA